MSCLSCKSCCPFPPWTAGLTEAEYEYGSLSANKSLFGAVKWYSSGSMPLLSTLSVHDDIHTLYDVTKKKPYGGNPTCGIQMSTKINKNHRNKSNE